MWVPLLCFLLVGLNVCRASRLLPENKELHIAPQQNLKDEEVAEMKPLSASGNDVRREKANNLLEFKFRESRTKGDAEHETAGLKVLGLWTSEPSTGVGHMEVSRGAMKRMHKERILGSTPSPGGGH
ncbi:hypothetical protein SUGI_0253720 [Cryptomeria japonica]|nr:hypothetical protein SUGI_0253720 [Cryptomeria japonica]